MQNLTSAITVQYRYQKRWKMNTFFSKDNERKHTSKLTKQWMEEKGILENVMVPPASSPDLNPIKKVWSAMKTYLRSVVKRKKKRWPCERNPCLLEDSDGWEMCKVYWPCSSGYSACDSKLWWTNTVLKDWPWWRTTVLQMVHSHD